MLFSVLMAHYNNARFLDESLKSVFGQTYTNWEIIVVDDASTDEFEKAISAYNNDSRIKVYRNSENMGCSYTKRKCVEKSSGSIIAFLDPDDTISPDALQIMMDAHIQKPECSIIHSTHYVCDENLKIIRIAEYPKALPVNTPYLLLNDGSVHAFAAFKKSCYNKTAGLTPIREYDKAIDQELYYILEDEGGIFFIDKPLYYYRIHAGSISNLGNEGAANNANYSIAEEACLRRMAKLKAGKQPDAVYWIQKYKTRYYKIRILNSFRRKQWARLITSMMIFPFVGGMENLVSYFKKLPKEGVSLIKKSFVENYRIID
jgi:glycosyltransferase involved in cell wall biosynthesis